MPEPLRAAPWSLCPPPASRPRVIGWTVRVLAAADGPGERRSLLDPRCAADLVAVKGWLGATVRSDADHTRSPAAGGEPALDCVLAPARHRRPRALRAGSAVSRAGFDGGCDPRILSLGKETLRRHRPLRGSTGPRCLSAALGWCSDGRPIAHVAEDLGVRSETLGKYVRRVEGDEGRGPDLPRGRA